MKKKINGTNNLFFEKLSKIKMIFQINQKKQKEDIN